MKSDSFVLNLSYDWPKNHWFKSLQCYMVILLLILLNLWSYFYVRGIARGGLGVPVTLPLSY